MPTIKLTDKQMTIIAECLEAMSRGACGQIGDLAPKYQRLWRCE